MKTVFFLTFVLGMECLAGTRHDGNGALEAFYEHKSCALSGDIEHANLPQDIAVKSDMPLRDVTAQAMDFWVSKLGRPGRPITWHAVKDFSDCMIYVKRELQQASMPSYQAHGMALSPGAPGFFGVATVSEVNAWVVAHEIGHLLGFKHADRGVMQELRDPQHPEMDRLLIDDFSVAYARAYRLAAEKYLRSAK